MLPACHIGASPAELGAGACAPVRRRALGCINGSPSLGETKKCQETTDLRCQEGRDRAGRAWLLLLQGSRCRPGRGVRQVLCTQKEVQVVDGLLHNMVLRLAALARRCERRSRGSRHCQLVNGPRQDGGGGGIGGLGATIAHYWG